VAPKTLLARKLAFPVELLKIIWESSSPTITLLSRSPPHFTLQAFTLLISATSFSNSSSLKVITFELLRPSVDEVSWAFANMAGGGILPIKFTELLQVCSYDLFQNRHYVLMNFYS
jgi:hypothetical protein